MRKKLNNKGVTLMEVLVSVVILAIVVLPLLNTFVFSSRLNAKSRIAARATEVARNLLEGTKYNSIDQMALKCNYPTDPASRFDFIKIPTGYDKVYELTFDGTKFEKAKRKEDLAPGETDDRITSSVKKDVSGKNKFVGKANKNYYFFMEDIESNGMKVNAYMRVKAKTAAGDPSVINRINDTKVAIIESMNKKTDILIGGGAEANQIANKLVLAGASSPNVNEIKRKIDIHIKDDGAGSVVTAEYNYKYGTFDYHDITKDIESKLEEKVKNIYLFYNPWYNRAEDKADEITITNELGSKVDVYIVKQRDPDPSVTSQLRIYENSYKAKVNVYEPVASGSPRTRIVTNIGSNIADFDKAQLGSVPQGIFTYTVNGSPATGLQISNYFSEYGAVDRFFEVEVAVFDNDVSFDKITTTDALITMKGGRTD